MSRARDRLPTPKELEEAQTATPKSSASKLTSGDYFHTAEIHGESEARGLTAWARERVLAYAS